MTEWPFIHLFIPWNWPHHRALYELLFSALENWNEAILLLMTILSSWFTQPAGASYLPSFEDQSFLWGVGQRLPTIILLFCFLNRILLFGSSLDHRRIIQHRDYWQRGHFFVWIGVSHDWLIETWFLKSTVKSRGFSFSTEYGSWSDYIRICKFMSTNFEFV